MPLNQNLAQNQQHRAVLLIHKYYLEITIRKYEKRGYKKEPNEELTVKIIATARTHWERTKSHGILFFREIKIGLEAKKPRDFSLQTFELDKRERSL
ncbi:hypothetical protein AB4168_23920 [Vibrio splendidus]